MEFKSYAFKELSFKQIKKLAQQYTGLNMLQFLSLDQSSKPVVVLASEQSIPSVYIWTEHSGLMKELFEDQVLEFAVGSWLLENNHITFNSELEALEQTKNWDVSRANNDT